MSVPGVNLEDVPEPQDLEPGGEPIEQPQAAAAEEDDADIVESVRVGEQKMVPLSALMEARKREREQRKANADLQTRQAQIDAQLSEFRPYAEKLKAHPELIDAIESGTRPSAPTTVQPADDQEAIEFAQDYGFITATGELDISRARRQLDKLDKRWEAKNAKQLAPLMQSEAQRAMYSHKEAARKVTLKDGSRLASDESIEQAFGMIGNVPQLAADPNVAAVMNLVAAGLDVAMGRRAAPSTRAELPDPLYTEPAGGTRRAPAANSELLRIGKLVGLGENDFKGATGITSRGKALE